jgi:hypothetical protein
MSRKNRCQTRLPPTLRHKAPFAYECPHISPVRPRCRAPRRARPLQSRGGREPYRRGSSGPLDARPNIMGGMR